LDRKPALCQEWSRLFGTCEPIFPQQGERMAKPGGNALASAVGIGTRHICDLSGLELASHQPCNLWRPFGL
jgi:hypothetical protein